MQVKTTTFIQFTVKKEKSLGFEQIKKKALDLLRSGKWGYGNRGAFATFLTGILNTAPKAKVNKPPIKVCRLDA